MHAEADGTNAGEAALLDVWIDGRFVIVLTAEAFHAKQFDSEGGAQKAAEKAAKGLPARKALGLMTRTMPLERINSVSYIPSMSVLTVRPRGLGDAITVSFADPTTCREVFERLHERMGSDLPPRRARAGMADVPASPELAAAALLAVFALVAMIGGALEAGRIEGGPAKFRLLAILGQALGLWGALAVAVVALAGAVLFLVRYVRRLPEKVVLRRVRP